MEPPRRAERALLEVVQSIDVMIVFTSGHPRDLMEICEHVLTFHSLNPGGDGAVEMSKAKALSNLEVRFNELWRRLEQPSGTQATAMRIANGQQVYGRVARARR